MLADCSLLVSRRASRGSVFDVLRAKMLIHYNLFSGSAERNEFLIDSEARSAESLYDDAPNARRRMRLSIRVIYIDVRKDRIIDKLINY